MSLERIALSLSGGGYRAAAFHLGALRLLHRTGLLGNVRAISTASGGTIVGALYAQSLARGTSFDEFFTLLREFLVTRDVIGEAIERLDAKRGVRTTLITSAADVWSTLLDGTLGEITSGAGHLEEVSFNATDLKNGLAFRFVKSASHLVRSGNRELQIPQEVASSIRVCDIAAASSCFPGAFEPMVFPRDFVLPEEVKSRMPRVPLMDGGIYDNLGVDSLLLVRARRSRELDTIIVSDADTSVPPLYVEPAFGSISSIRVRTLYIALLLLAGLSAGSFLSSLRDFPWSLPQLLVFAVVTGGCFAVLKTLVGLSQQPIAGRARPMLWRHLMRLTVGDLAGAAAARGASLVSLTSRLFMKRVRTLTYARVFENRRTRGRAVGNLITDLAGDMSVAAEIRAFAARASAMPTTLWSDSPSQVDDLIHLGELTLCRNLLKRIEATGGDEKVRARLTEEWGRIASRE